VTLLILVLVALIPFLAFGDFWTEQQRSANLQIAAAHANTVAQTSQQQQYVIQVIAQNDALEAVSIATYRQNAELTNAQNQNALYTTTANLQALGEIIIASAQGSGILVIAGYDVGNIQASAAAQVAQYQGSANATTLELNQVATVQAGGSAATAAITATTAASEATLNVSRTAQIAQIGASLVATTAQVDQTQGIALANLQASEVSQEAAIAVTERGQLKAIRVTEVNAEALVQVDLTSALAIIQVNEIQQETTFRVQEIAGVAAQGFRGSTVAAVDRATAETTDATLRANASIAVAGINARYSVYSATDRSLGIHFRSDEELGASEFSDTQAANLVAYRANQDFQGDIVSANSNLQGVQYSADGDNARRTAAATTDATAQEFGADQDYAGVVAKEAALNQTLAVRLAYLQGKFNLILTDFQSSLLPRAIPGFLGGLPEVSCRQVYSPSQIQQRINAAYAQVEVQSATALEAAKADYAGRGFSGVSPALYLERAKLTATKLRAIASAGLSTRADLYAENAERVLAAQDLKSKLFLALQQAYTEAEKIEIQRQVGFLDEATQIVGGI